MNKLPTYEMVIDPSVTSDVEVSFVALVDKPAIEKNFLAFKEGEFGGPGSGPNPGGGSDSDSNPKVAVQRANDLVNDAQSIVDMGVVPPELKNDVEIAIDSVKGRAETIKDSKTPEEKKQRVKKLQEEHAKLQDLMDKVLISRRTRIKSSQLHFAVDPERRIISGPAMVADSLIYRRDDQGEYNVFFSKDTIEQICLKFAKKGYAKNLNLFHDPSLALDGVTIFNSFVSDRSMGIPPMESFKDLPDGTWFISAKVENDAVWEKIKSGEVKGFSVEGIFSYVKKQNATGKHNSHLDSNNSLMATIQEMFADLKKLILGPVPPAIPAPEILAVDYTRIDGTPLSIDKLEVGGVCLANGAPCPPGPCELTDGTKLMIGEGGVITEVMPKMPMENPTDYSEQFKTYDQKFTDYETKLAAYEQKSAAYEQRFTEMGNQLSNANATIVQLVSIVEKLAEAPAADPIGEPKGSFSSMKVETKEEKRERFAKAFQELKNKNK
jgi:hypothetical protein